MARGKENAVKNYTEDRDLAGIKLLAVDMDLTLLAGDGSLPPHMDERIDALSEAGVLFCPASGRPAPTLQMMFPAHAGSIAFCADNGGWVIYQGRTAFRNLIRPELWHEVLDFAAADGRCAPVLCAFEQAYVLKRDRPYHEAIYKYYKDIRYVESFDEVDAEADKVTILFPDYDAEPRFASTYEPRFGKHLYVTNAGREWIDFMNLGVSKGSGVAHLCRELGIGLADAAAVGDTYNDIPMLSAVGHSFVVANAEKHMHDHADYLVPSNDDRGVATLIDAILAAKGR